jgi:uncharacterized protein
MTPPVLRAAEERDVDAVLRLNAGNVPSVSAMDADRFAHLRGIADRTAVVDVADEVAGFVMTFAPQAAYDSANYQAFVARYDSFYYLDRIVIADRFRRRGLARFVYEQLEAVATPFQRMTLEVNTVPANPASLAFHASRGYLEVGTLDHGTGHQHHQVALLVKELP